MPEEKLEFHEMKQVERGGFFHIRKATNHTLSNFHNHSYLQIWYVLKGSFRHIFDGKAYNHSAGDILIVPPYMPHQLDTRNSVDMEWIFMDISTAFLKSFPDSDEKNTLFNLAYLRPLLYNASNSNPFLHFSPEVSRKIEKLLFGMLEERRNFSSLSPVYIRTDLIRLFSIIADEYTTDIKQEDALFVRYREALQDAMDYIDQNYTKQITRDDICKIALMSPSTFSNVFRHLTGKTFVEYLHLQRIRLAKRLLTESDKSVTEICFECGFSDVTHFGRVFRKIVGHSPSQYSLLKKLNDSENKV